MRFYVTGQNGFIGSHLVEWIYENGHELVDSEWRTVPEVVIHTAWQYVDQREKNNPGQLDNIEITSALAWRCRQKKVKRFVALGSQAERFDDSLYAEVKRDVNDLLQRRCKQAGIEFIWARLFSVYGPRDRPEKLIPKCIDTLLSGEQLHLDSCDVIWDYLYVEDAIKALAVLALDTRAEGEYDIGYGEEVYIANVVEMIGDMLDKRGHVYFGDGRQERDLYCNNKRIVDLSWCPTVSIEEGLERTIQWHKRKKEATS